MKVLHVINMLGPGGAETLLMNYLALSTKDIQNELCILYQTDRFYLQHLSEREIPVHSFHFTKKFSWGIFFKLRRLIHDNSYDLVHVHLFPAQYFCALAAWFERKPQYIFSEHNSFNRRRNYRIFRLTDYISYLPYQKIICVCETTRKDLLSWIPSLAKKAITIYNGVPVFQLLQEEVIYDLVLVGSLRSKVKGVDILLRAVGLLGPAVNSVAVAGTGRMMPKYIQMRNELGLEKKVHFLGNCENVNRLLAQSKILVMPSRWEGLPIVLLEAMSAAKPIIAAKVGGIGELIIQGRNGILVPPDDVPAFVEAIGKLLADREMAAQLGLAAREDVVSKYSMPVYMGRLHELYQTATENKGFTGT